jgi:hypothetical protein
MLCPEHPPPYYQKHQIEPYRETNADPSGIHTRCVHASCGHSIVLLVSSKEIGLEVYHKKDTNRLIFMSRI